MIWLISLHCLASFWMTAVIFFVQIVHYPLFLNVPFEARVAYGQAHQKAISWIVIPAMLIELGTFMALFSQLWQQWLFVLSGLFLLGIWLSTFLLQVPCHAKMLSDPQDVVLHRLVNTNWIRTLLWTLKTCAWAYMIGDLYLKGLL